MQCCHLISAYRDYLFKSPSDTLAGLCSWGGRANKEEKAGGYPREPLEESFRCPYRCRGGDNTIPSHSEHLLHLHTTPNLSLQLSCFPGCYVVLIAPLKGTQSSQQILLLNPTPAEPALYYFCPMVHLYFCRVCSLHLSLLIDVTWIKHSTFKHLSTVHTGNVIHNQAAIWQKGLTFVFRKPHPASWGLKQSLEQ